MILCSLTTTGRTAVSEILLLDYYYSERYSSFFSVIYTATKRQKMNQEETQDDRSWCFEHIFFNHNKV